MYQAAWDEIENIYELPHVDPAYVHAFRELKKSQDSHTKKEGNLRHYCSFFLPYDAEKGKIYLGWHIKADDWISPGGHIEPGETPMDAAIREMKEELGIVITSAMIEPWNLSVKPINRPLSGCVAHYDVWHLVHIPEQQFDYLKSEYYDAGWFTVEVGLGKITKNPDFAKIIALLRH
jgi:8-oxo-dGTP pyrophosphatase MutT (NUDIX family)